MVREQLKNPDFFLLTAVAALLVLGVLILSSASASLSQSKFHESYYLLNHQFILGIIPGLILAILAYKIPLDFFKKLAPVGLLVTVILLIMVFTPLGFAAGGAQRWVHLGFASVQPSEMLKLIFIFYLASWLAHRTSRPISLRKGAKNEFGNTLLVFLAVMGFIGILLIKQPDLSTFGIIAVTAFGMYFAAGTPLKHTLLMIGAGAALLVLLVIFEPYRLERLSSWLSPETDPMGKGFQSSQALILTGSGGTFGQGFGSSSQKYTLLPELIGDSVFASFAQEFGFAGCLLLVALFLIFAWRGFLIARQSFGKFEYLVALGITIWIVLQSVINISSTIRLIPLSGVPLPFISYGGTAIAMELMAVGILLNISRQKPNL